MPSGNSLMSGCTFPLAGVCNTLQLGTLHSNRGMQLDTYCLTGYVSTIIPVDGYSACRTVKEEEVMAMLVIWPV